MTARERAREIVGSIADYLPDNGTEILVDAIASALADAERGVWRDVWNESVRIQGNGSPLTDFGKGVIAATKDIQTFICERSKREAPRHGE